MKDTLRRLSLLTVPVRAAAISNQSARQMSRTFLINLVIVLAGTFSVVPAQRVGGTGGTVKVTTPTATGTPARRTNAPVRTVVRTVIERVTPTTGSLSVAAEANATILVEPIRVRGATGQQGIVPAGERIFVFVDLKPGRYRVAGALAGHLPVETEVVIAANKSQASTLNFRPVLYSLIVTTNVNTGELKYAREGEPLTNVVPIQNKTVRRELPAGDYVLELSAEEFGYETLRKSVTLNADNTVLDLPLRRVVLTTDTLSPTWTNTEMQAWEIPAGWRPDNKRNLMVKGAGVALPREETFRHYKDFRLSSTAKMTSGVSLSFALRARDARNYYLLQLTGEKSDEPNTVRLFVVKNGVAQRIRAIPIARAGAKAMSPDRFFSVSIKMVDFAITVEIEDSETGAPYPLGVLTDPARNFVEGAVGIAGGADEDNTIGRFVVCTGDKCLSS
ncbi:MAG: hypothetical protein ACR2H6_01220 [Pyrinomonadaceae bacterium]